MAMPTRLATAECRLVLCKHALALDGHIRRQPLSRGRGYYPTVLIGLLWWFALRFVGRCLWTDIVFVGQSPTSLTCGHPRRSNEARFLRGGSVCRGGQADAEASSSTPREAGEAGEVTSEAEEMPEQAKAQVAYDVRKPDDFVSTFAFFTAVSCLGLFFSLVRLCAASQAGSEAAPVEDIGRSFGINAVITALFGFLAKLDYDQEAVRVKGREEDAFVAAIARLPVRVERSEETATPLSELPPGGSVVLCMGSAAFCQICLESAAQNAELLKGSGLLLVPMPLTVQLLADESALAALPSGVARPDFARAAEDWSAFFEREFDRVYAQGLDMDFADATQGLLIAARKEGAVLGRFLGAPDWQTLARQSAPRNL